MVQSQDLLCIINHVFLPPKLPQGDDGEGLQDVALLVECERAWELFQPHLPTQESSKWAGCSTMLRKMLELRDSTGNIIPDNAKAMLGSMSRQDVLAFHIHGQNAALIVRRMESQFSFESFELSPTNKAVMAAKGRLCRYFPGPAISVSEERMADPSFRDAIVQLLISLDVQTPLEALPVGSKAQSESVEIQDTAHPKFVAEMMFGILRGVGKPLNVHRIDKRTRDDVLWSESGKLWRRSPCWLLVRVALQTSLATRDDRNHIHYKSFMIFFMARLLQQSLETSISSDLLFVLTAKLSRRLLKLGLGNELSWINDIHGLIEIAHRKMTARWMSVEQNQDPFKTQSSWDPSALSFSQDTRLSLQNLGPYLKGIPSREKTERDRLQFTPECHQRIEQSGSSFPSLDTSETGVEIRLWLADIELWVEDYLMDWLKKELDSHQTTTILSRLIEKYATLASLTYSGDPEAISLMLLTSIDLWVALDKCAIHQCSMLSQYNPEFPESLFDHLLLPRRCQMERLSRIEKYLRQRRYLITTSVFQSVSFALQYFEQSLYHQQLRRRIESSAQEARSHKKIELQEKQQRYRELMRDSEARTCEYGTYWDRGREVPHHSTDCRKCRLKWEANRIEIEVHEWPLPLGEYAIKAAVFELEVPIPVANWRQATYLLLIDVFSPADFHSQQPSVEEVYCMKDYSGLSKYVTSKSARLQLASFTKSFVTARYPSKLIFAATEDNICVNNGLTYSMYDSKLRQWTKDLLGQCSVRKKCTLQLPSGPYQQLQFSVAGTTHTSNEVLAMQSQCPESMSLHEFYAFASLRCGNRLQWRNMVRELVSRVLDFSLEETNLVVVQAAWEVGKADQAALFRESHVDLQEEDFGMSLLMVLNEALGSVEGSWKGAVASRTFVTLALRTLSLSPFKTVQNQCFLFLRRARAVTLNWMRQVGQLLDETEDLDDLTDLNIRVLEMALTCHGTFDVDRHYILELISSAQDIATVVECSITIHDHCPVVKDNLPRVIKSLLDHFSRLSHSLESFFRHNVLRCQQGIDNSVRRIWSGYRPSGVWCVLPAPNERWLVTTTHSDESYTRMAVNYNILDGCLLVNGLPLTRLPQSYQLHATYRRFFGEKVLAVVPSSMVGMQFETRSGFFGQQIHFSMIDSELIIRSRNDSQVYELLPLHFLDSDFPKALVQDYAHWLNVDNGSVEWRLMTLPWNTSQASWHMQADNHGTYRMTRDGSSLVDIQSQTAREISRILSPLEHATNIHILLDDKQEDLNIHLPRFKLDFHLKRQGKSLESKQFRGMAVDKVQSIGTLTGLASKLVLRKIDGSCRIVLVPDGKVSFSPDGHHVRVTINTDLAIYVQHHLYTLDDQLGRLVDNSSLHSRLFRIYLHATTSHCLVDQLTGRTGTEEALNCLASAASRSFIELGRAEVELLEMLALLTPRRHYYPENLRETQQVEWLDLSPLSQHCGFYKLVRSILDQASSYHIFYNQLVQAPISQTRSAQHLLDRASIRDSSFQVHSFGAENHTAEFDVIYAARDQAVDSYRELQTCHTARLVDTWSQNLVVLPQLLQEIESWGEPIRGIGKEDQDMLGFDLKWLEAPAKFLPGSFYALHHQLSHASKQHDKYKIMMLLSTLAYSEHAQQDLVLTLLAFATVPELRTLQLPRYPVFRLSDGYIPQRKKLSSIVATHFRPFEECVESKLPKLPGETKRILERRRQDEYYIAKEQQIKSFVEELLSQPPLRGVSTQQLISENNYILVREAVKALRPWFESWHRNAHFQKHVGQIQIGLNRLPPKQTKTENFSFFVPVIPYIPRRTHITFIDMTENAAPHYSPADEEDFDTWVVHSKQAVANQRQLEDLLACVSSRCASRHDERYVADLFRSYDALRGDVLAKLAAPLRLVQFLERHLMQAQRQENNLFKVICTHLGTGNWYASRNAHLLPRLSKLSILSQLSSDKIGGLPPDWRKLFIQYGISVTELQRARRLLACARNPTELLGELRNPGHRNWNPDDHPEWLLIEIENDILIRQDQSQVSMEMISPSSGANSVLQLSMGLGKSSVIVPLAAATLADKTRLVRVVVLKSLTMQMFNLLKRKLGGLLNRRIFYMPITRSLRLDQSRAAHVYNMLEECKRIGGILLMQPEHILSFELMGFEKLLSGDLEAGNTLIQTQHWLQENSRDIIDESDEILSVRYELIYTMGMQQAIEFSPDRWHIIQGVLHVLGKCIHQGVRSFPGGLEITSGKAGAFPRVQILQTKAGDTLIADVTRQVCESGIPGVPLWRLPPSARNALFEFLLNPTWSSSASKSLNQFISSSKSIEKALLLLKGLLGKGVLRFCLEQKRWRVQYGLDLSRTKLAVPYDAKDNPAPRAEFSHPDATIVLTCLSYYYGGLSDEQIQASFEALLKTDHAPEEYAHWVQDAPRLPQAFKQLTGVNLGNLRQCHQEVFPPLRFTMRIINFYLSNIVFPAEMKEFPDKLSSSGWDIAKAKRHPTTGFSGTNDSRYHLPLSITQCDLPQQLSTNAGVLGRLLRSENIVADISHISTTGVLDATALIKLASTLDPPARVILDVGAQILELQNEEMAWKWLSSISDSEAQAAIFFDTHNEICVLSRDGSKELLEVSPFLKQMDACLMYLDEVHTRGTDLKMPANYRAIVTLGPGLTKDRLVQACMRMRKLGEGQSVAFCISMEIHNKILSHSGKVGGMIEVSDVLEWSISNTCAYFRKSVPLWATQGLRYQRRHAICSQSLINRDGDVSSHLIRYLPEKEAQSLQERYGEARSQLEGQLLSHNVPDKLLARRGQQVAEIRARCEEFDVSSFNMANLYEEQERELSPENEREKQVARPPAAMPRKHAVHFDVQSLVTHGVLKPSSDAFRPAFDTLRETTADTYYETAWLKDLLVTTDFTQTVHGVSKQFFELYLRPVNWIISCRERGKTSLLIVSPFEVQELLPLIRKHKRVTLHVYTPRLNISTRTLEDLSFCTIPPVPKSWSIPPLVRHLNIFAGQLYLRNYEDYVEMCGFLGLCSKAPEANVKVAADGFVSPSSRKLSSGLTLRESPFTNSPVEFLRKIMTMRRKGQSFAASHFGMILNGELIPKEKFEW